MIHKIPPDGIVALNALPEFGAGVILFDSLSTHASHVIYAKFH